MRIARVLTRLNLGGPARQVLASDPLLVGRGFEIRIFAGVPEPGEGDLFDELLARGLDVVRVGRLRRGLSPTGDLLAGRELARRISDFAPDVLHTHASKAGALGRRALRRVRDGGRVARVHTFHGHVLEGYFPRWISRGLIALETRLAAQTDRVVAVSHATGEDLVRLGVVGEGRLVVVPPGVELGDLLALAPLDEAARRRSGAIRRTIAARDEDVVVGVVGRLSAVKRPDRAVDVFELLAGRYPRLQVAFIGDGSERPRLERRLATPGGKAAGRVHLLGARGDMAAVMADLDAVLLTSRSEGLPVSLIEAAAAGLPVVASDVGGVGEIVAHERTGFLAATTEELAFGLAQLLDDPRLRAACGHRARLRVAKRHSARALADRLEGLYRTVVGERRGVAGSGEPGEGAL